MHLFQFMRSSNGARSPRPGQSEDGRPRRPESPRLRHRSRRLEHWVSSRVGLTRTRPGLNIARQNEERKPPPRPTPLEFPSWIPTGKTKPFTKTSADHAYTLFNSLHSATGIKEEHLEALNLTCEEEVSLETLMSDNAYLPPGDWPPRKDREDGETFTLSNGRQAPGMDLFRDRAKDIMLDNTDAFCAAQRIPPPEGRKPVKLGNFFKFWVGLHYVAEYWDSSEDRYYEEEVVEKDDGQIPDSTGSKKRKREKYEGRRIGAGHEMPDIYREDVVRDFVDPVAWLFGCQIIAPRMQPRFVMRKTLYPVRITHSVFRTPLDRQQARAGCADGPIIAIQCRPETSFVPSGTEDVAFGHRLNILREISAALLTAQERGREGKTMLRPGEGQWYTTVPRWGGGPGGEVGDAVGDTDASAPKKEDKKKDSNRGKSRREINAEIYKRVAPGVSVWDSKINYLHIGRHSNFNVDHIYLISSINHHVSIVDFRVHADYLAVLETGTVPKEAVWVSDGQPWYELKIRRTRWYDLFKAEDRFELLRGVWGIMAFMMRGEARAVGQR